MRAQFAPLVALLLAACLAADPVRLRSKANGNIIEAEVVEVTAENLAFRLVGGERLYTVGWDTLDLDWIKDNSPALWNERQLLLKPAEPEKPKEDPAADPFAKETPPPDTRTILRNLGTSLADRTRGIDPGRIEGFCRHEAKVDEEVFWKAYEEMRRDGAPAPAKADASKDSGSRAKDRKDRPEWERNPAFRQKEEALREQQKQGRAGLTHVAYLRALAEGGFKGRVAWHLLRLVPEEKAGLVERLRKYEAQAADLATRSESPDTRRDAMVLRKQLADLIALLGRLSRETTVQEERLKNEAASLLAKIGK
jgi:hypothetical protein